MEGNTDVKDTIATLGEDLRARVSRNSEPVVDGIKKSIDTSLRWVRKYPIGALGLGVLAGAAAGIVATRLLVPTQSDGEKKVRHWVHNAQAGWGDLRQALITMRRAFSRLS